MKLLVDTHTAIWLLDEPARLTPLAVRHLTDPGNTVFLSAVSVWEIAIKQAIGKIRPPEGYVDALTGARALQPLAVTVAHAQHVGDLPLHHRDPFDRLLIAQASVEGAAIVTADAAFSAYDPPVIW